MSTHAENPSIRPALRAVIYARVSLDMSGEGESVARQLDACRSLAAARGYEVVGVETDTQSAFQDKRRPGWERAKAAAERGEIDVIIGRDNDRLLRTMRELEDVLDLFRRTGAAVATVAGELDLTTPQGALVARILTAVASNESEMKGARLRFANLDRAKRGVPRRNASPLFGYDANFEVIDAEARAIRRAAHDLIHGANLITIQRRWNAAGLLPRHHRSPNGWSHGGLSKMITNPRLAGLSTYHGEVVGVGSWKPILRRSTHEALLVALAERARHMRPRSLVPRTLLERLAFCQRCGAPHMAILRGDGMAYSCRNRHAHVYADRADAYVRGELIRTAAATLGMSVDAVSRSFDDAALEQQRAMLAAVFTVGIAPGKQHGPRPPISDRIHLEPKDPRSWLHLLSS